MKKKLTPEDIDLWQSQVKDVKKLPKTRKESEKPKLHIKIRSPEKHVIEEKSERRVPSSPPQHFARKDVRRVRVDARLDLHGMNFEEAQRALKKFLLRAQEKGFKTVLIITGKGPLTAERTLRRYLPRWLEEAPLRSLITSFHHPAKPQHGGEGAYYVKVRPAVKD